MRCRRRHARNRWNRGVRCHCAIVSGKSAGCNRFSPAKDRFRSRFS
jgi:hypothetical protein